MIKLFRNQRRKAFSHQQISNYLLYAIGEIVLVVIGILLALYINDVSEAHKHDEKVTAILKEIQLDLLEDIQKADEVIAYYEQRDSMIRRVFSGKLTRESYQKPENYAYFFLILSLHDFQFHDNGFANLMRNSDIIPARFDNVLNQLKKIYISDKKRIEQNFEIINRFALNNLDDFAKEKSWFHQLSSGQFNDEILDYFLNDPFYKNKLMHYRTLAIKNLLSILLDYRHYAALTYQEIAKEADPEAPLPDLIGPAQPEVAERELRKCIGQYIAEQQMKATISLDHGSLYIQLDGQPRLELSAKTATLFHRPRLGVEIEFQIEKNQLASQFVLRQNGVELTFLRQKGK